MTFVPAISLHAAVPVRFERHAIQQTHAWQDGVEHCDHENRGPYNSCVDLGELESEKVCADRKLQNGNAGQVDDLSEPYVVAVCQYIIGLPDRGISDMSTLSRGGGPKTKTHRRYVQRLFRQRYLFSSMASTLHQPRSANSRKTTACACSAQHTRLSISARSC